MMNKERAMIFPYDGNTAPLLRNSKFIDNYDMVLPCTFESWNLDSRDAAFADGGSKIGIQARSDFSKCLKDVDVVIFVEGSQAIARGELIYPKMYEAIAQGKKIIDLLEFNELEAEMKSYSLNHNVKYITCRNDTDHWRCNKDIVAEGLLDVNIPIVLVVGEGKDTGKFLTELKLTERLERKGYKVSLIGSNDCCKLVGGKPFPAFMRDNGMTDVEQVLLFNRYIKYVEELEKPDLILLGVPGGVISCTKRIYGDFGILAYKVSQAIKADFVMMNLFYEEYPDSVFEDIHKMFQYRFGMNVDLIGISNHHVDWEELVGAGTTFIPSLVLSEEFLEERMKAMNRRGTYSLINLLSDSDMDKAAETIENTLSEGNAGFVF